MSEYGFGFYSSESSERNTQKDFHSDGGQGSGDWGHQGRPGIVGGSGGGGGAENRYVDPKGGYTSFAKVRATAAKPHQPSTNELREYPRGTKLIVNGQVYTKGLGTTWHDENGNDIGSHTLNTTVCWNQQVKVAIAKNGETATMKNYQKASATKAQTAKTQGGNKQTTGNTRVQNRQEAYDHLRDKMGIKIDTSSLDRVGEANLVASVNKLSDLESKYGIADGNEISLKFDGKFIGNGVAGAFHGTYGELAHGDYHISLCDKYNSDKDSVISSVKNQQIASRLYNGQGWKMQTADTDEARLAYTITHEYGHMLQERMLRDYVKEKDGRVTAGGLMVYEKQFQNECKKELMNIVKESNKKLKINDVASGYGQSKGKPYEFFAEAFASYEGGAPNELGKAMGVWLQRKGVIS